MEYLLPQEQCGIFLGSFFYSQLATTYLPIILILVAIFLLLFVQKDEIKFIEEEQEKVAKIGTLFKAHDIVAILLLIGASIIVRSIGGGAIKYEWKPKDALLIGILYSSCVMLGKAFGGMIGDKLGLRNNALISLAAACMSLILGFSIPFFGYFGIFLFNIPMSITLLLLEKCNTKYLATMVGSNTLFLFVGYLICLNPLTFNNYTVLVVSILLAIVSIYLAFKIYDKKSI